MEEIREAALAYYAKFSEENKKLATELFQAMDKRKMGKVNLKEYAEFFKQNGFPEVAYPEFFKSLDTDGDGNLDFNEFIIVYYLLISKRLIFCKKCKMFLTGLYFTCAQCFDGSDQTYDLCCSCYGNEKIDHHKDASFVDNYSLLRHRRKEEDSASEDKKNVLKIIKLIVRVTAVTGQVALLAPAASCTIQ